MNDNYTRFLQGLIVVVVLLAFVAALGALMFVDVKTGNREMVLQMLGVLMAAFTGVIGYFIGSSSGSAKKDEQLAAAAAAPAALPAPVKIDDSTPVKVQETT